MKRRARKSDLSGFEENESGFPFIRSLRSFSLSYLIYSVLNLAHFKDAKTQSNSKHVTQASRRTKKEERPSKGHHVTTQGILSFKIDLMT